MRQVLLNDFWYLLADSVVFSNAGGGGERVLWAAILATQRKWPKAICAVYTGDHDVDKTKMLENIEVRSKMLRYRAIFV